MVIITFSVNNRFSLSAKHFLEALHISLGCDYTYDASLTFNTMVFPQKTAMCLHIRYRLPASRMATNFSKQQIQPGLYILVDK